MYWNLTLTHWFRSKREVLVDMKTLNSATRNTNLQPRKEEESWERDRQTKISHQRTWERRFLLSWSHQDISSFWNICRLIETPQDYTESQSLLKPKKSSRTKLNITACIFKPKTSNWCKKRRRWSSCSSIRIWHASSCLFISKMRLDNRVVKKFKTICLSFRQQCSTQNRWWGYSQERLL